MRTRLSLRIAVVVASLAVGSDTFAQAPQRPVVSPGPLPLLPAGAPVDSLSSNFIAHINNGGNRTAFAAHRFTSPAGNTHVMVDVNGYFQ
jgi:hypothetical protein